MLVSDKKAPTDTILLAGIMDRLSFLVSGDKATMIAKNFISTTTQDNSFGFETGAEFDAAWNS